MSTKFLSPGWRMPRNTNQSKQSNYSMDFDTASTNAINCGTVPTMFIGDSSVSIWFKSEVSHADNNVILARHKAGSGNYDDTYVLRTKLDGSGVKIRLEIGNPLKTFDSQNVYSKSVWHHLAVTLFYSGGQYTVKFYVDGVEDSPTNSPMTMTEMPSSTSRPLLIGAMMNWNNVPTQGHTGLLDAVSIFDYALSASQVTTLYGTGSAIGNSMALPSPPIAYYPLGESAGGFVGGSGTWLTENNAIGDYVFDFASDWIQVNQSSGINISGNLTLSAWVYMEDSTWNPVISKSTDANNRNYEFAIRPTTGTISFYTNNGSYERTDSSLAVSLNTWTHIVISCESGVTNGTKFYFNNTLDPAPTGGTHTITADTADLYLGTTAWNSMANYFNGQISNVQIWNTNLSTSEVETLYNYGSPIQTLASIPQSSNLRAWYKLDASEIYNISITDWEINEASSFWKNSVDFNLTFSSSNKAYIQCANTTNLNLTGAMTISAWMKGDQLSSGNYNGLGTQGNDGSRGYGLLRGTNHAIFSISDNGSNHRYVSSPTNTWLDGWNHIVGVFDPNSRFEVYVNGIFSASGTNYAQQISTNPFQIGSRGDGSHYYNWLGQLSNVSIWNTALSNGSASVGSVAGGEIATLYNGGKPLQDLLTGPQNSNLLSWWKLDNTTTGIQDSKGTNNGTIVTAGNGSVSKFDQSVSTLNGESSGMTQANLIQSDLQTVAPYSKYAMKFDGTDYIEVDSTPILNGATSLSISAWCKIDNNVEEPICSLWVSAGNQQYLLRSNTSYGIQFYLRGSWGMQSEGTNQALTPGQWYHIVATWDGSFIYIYVNGSLAITPKAASGTLDTMTGQKDWIGRHSANYLDGSLSNVTYWKNTALNQSQVREIYNEGLPSNLHNFSGTAPTAWWQLGENSSYVGGWTFADEMPAGNNGTGYGLSETDLINGVGTTANGTSTGMAVGALVGNAPYSDANAVSSNMAVTARSTSVP